MPDKETIFLTTDFSDSAKYALHYAAAFAKRLGAAIRVGHVVDTSYFTYAALYGQGVVVDPDIPSVERAAEQHLRETVELLRTSGIEATGEFTRGAPLAELTKMIDASGAFLVITGTHGHTGFNRFLFGSTCEKLLRQSKVPVIAVKQPAANAVFDEESFAVDRVACTTDLSDLSRAALPLAADLCVRLDAELTLVHVIDSRFDALPYAAMEQPGIEHLRERAESVLREWAGKLNAPRVQTRVLHGVPHERVAEFVRDFDVDLLVISTHGHGGLAHALLGSTTERVIRTVPCPVLAIRPS